jgi:hypothetical protein
MDSIMGGLIPPALARRVADAFGDFARPAFGQLATVGPLGAEVRTVHFRFEDSLETLIFNTHVSSRKLVGLSPGSTASACYHDALRNFQWQWRFSAALIPEQAGGELAAVRTRQWGLSREDLRRCYWLDYAGRAAPDLGEVCPTFATVVCSCSFWQLFEMNDEQYELGRRTQYRRSVDGRWSEHPLPLLYTPSQS